MLVLILNENWLCEHRIWVKEHVGVYMGNMTGFKFLLLNYCGINQVTSKYLIDFLEKTCKKGLKQKK